MQPSRPQGNSGVLELAGRIGNTGVKVANRTSGRISGAFGVHVDRDHVAWVALGPFTPRKARKESVGSVEEGDRDGPCPARDEVTNLGNDASNSSAYESWLEVWTEPVG